MPEDNQQSSVGSLWKKRSKKGMDFLSGKITLDGATFPIVVFKNNKKRSENSPDYRIIEGRDNRQNNRDDRRDSRPSRNDDDRRENRRNYRDDREEEGDLAF